MSDVRRLVRSMEELFTACSRSIVSPETITEEANQIMAIMNDHNLDQKFIVEGLEALSLLASNFMRCGYHSFLNQYARISGINHLNSGFSNKDDLMQYCEFCVEYGEKNLNQIKNSMMKQLKAENRMSKEEICSMNIARSDQSPATVQDLITNYLKLSLLVNSLKEFFKEYYKGMN